MAVEVKDKLVSLEDLGVVNDELQDLKEAISTLPEDGIVANALQLDSNVYTEDHSPYLFRKSVGGSRKYMEIVGASFPVNQLINSGLVASTGTSNGVTATKNDDDSFTISGTATASAIIPLTNAFRLEQNHIYYFGKGSNFNLYDGYGDDGNNIVKWTRASATTKVYTRIQSGTTVNEKLYPQASDLTQMFGTDIADYAYTLEQSNAGAGVAWLRNHGFFTKPYYPYNAGTMQSVLTSGHETVGFNAWDEEWESGDINIANGTKRTSSTRIRSKNFIPVIPNTVYYCKSSDYLNMTMCFYDFNKGWVSSDANVGYTGAINTTSVTPIWCHYIMIYCNGTTYNNDICINISDPTKNGTYEPYEKHTYPLEAVELQGVPMLDNNNELWYYGDTYESSGTHTTKMVKVDLGTLTTWYYNGDNNVFTTISDMKSGSEYCVSSELVRVSSATSVNNMPNKSFKTISGQNKIAVQMDGIDASNASTMLSGIYLIYEKTTPTTEQLTPFQSPMICDENGTEEFIDTREVPIPVGTNTEYPTNQVKKLDGLPSDFSTLIAPTEKTTTASRNYAVGNYLIYKNVLYKVTSAIASGGTITIGTNVTATTIMTELLALA